MTDTHPIPSPDPLSQLRELAAGIDKHQPDPADLQRLRDLLDAHPDLWRTVADLAQHALHTLVNRVKDRPVFTESLKHGLASLKIDLAYDTASALERLLIEQVLLCWLRLHLTELTYTQLTGQHLSLAASAHWDKHLTRAQHRFLQACQALARIRKLARTTPALQVNIATQGGQQINTIRTLQPDP